MPQCPQCGSFNDGQAAFCNQCGGRLAGLGTSRGSSGGAAPRRGTLPASSTRRGGGQRGRIGFLLLAALLALLVVVILVTRRGEEPDRTVVRPISPPEVESSEETAPTVDEETAPVSVSTARPRPENVPSGATVRKRVSALVSRALVILELRDDQQRTTEQRGVLVDESGVVLCRFQPLIGARAGTARLLTEERVRTEILGLSFRDEAADLALLRLAPLGDAFPRIPLATAARSDALGDGDGLFVFNDYRAIPAVIDARDQLGLDGVRRMLLGETTGGVGIPPQVFLVVDPGARVIGLCRTDELASPDPEPGVDLFRISVDEATSLSESLHLPVGLSLEDLTDRLYAGTFPDLYDRGRRAYRRQEWKTAIKLFEGALGRVALDGPSDEEVEDVNASLRESYSREVDRLSKARRYRETVEVADGAVARYEDDSVLWRLLGEARLALDQHEDGIVALLESRSLEPSRSVDESLLSAYLEVAAEYARAGEERNSELSLLEGIEALPASAELRIELAKLYMRFEAYDDAVRLLEQARGLDARFADVIDALLAKIRDALRPRDSVVIPMTSSNSIRARAVVDGRVELNFIIDTGATYTAIPESVAINLDYDVRRAPKVPVRTAGGAMKVPLIQMQSVNLGGYIVRNLKVLALPDDLAPGVNLLGLNYLNHFKYSVDARKREFRLERP